MSFISAKKRWRSQHSGWSLRQLNVLRLLAVVVCVPLAAQQRPPSLAGTVVAAHDGKPVKRAEVIVRPAGGGAPLGVTTDDRGRFTFFAVPEGRYNLYARRDGFLPSTYVLHGGTRLPLPFAFSTKQAMDGIQLRLPPAAIMTGKVRHHDADPASSVAVEAYRGFYDRGRFVYETAGRAITNDRGEYRMYNLPPGKYHLAAIVIQFRDAPVNLEESYPADATGIRLPPERSVTTFFPSAWKLTEAEQLDVAAGAELSSIDITLARTRSTIVHVRATSALGGRPLRGTSVMLFRPDAREAGYLPARTEAKPLQDGTFEIRGVVPGTYYLEASASEDRKILHARQLLAITEAREVKVDLILRPEVVLDGIVRADGNEPVRFDSLRLSAEPRIEAPIKTAAVDTDGRFKLSLLAGVDYSLVLTNAPDNVYLKSARIDAIDVLTRGLTITAGTLIPLNVAVDTKGAAVQGWSAPAANVLLMPEDGRLEKYQSALANEYGVFMFRGVAPGAYHVIAWFDTPPCEVHDPDTRAGCSSFAVAIKAAEAGTYTIEIAPTDKIEARINSGQ